MSPKGVTLLLVVALVLVIVIMANITITVLLSQSRFTHHTLSRIQALYAARAGINLALEQLRNNSWGTGAYCIGRSGSGCAALDNDIPYQVNITVGAPNINGIRQISASVNYTYTW